MTDRTLLSIKPRVKNVGNLNTIGGRPNSYNFRETWPKKVISILEGVGAVSLSEKLYNNTSFEVAWSL